jgi:hypothetical protein
MLNDLIAYLHTYAIHNKYGAYFILGYAITWLLVGIIWLRVSEKTGALITLFQGLVGLPLAFLFSYLAGTLSGTVDPTIAQLSNSIAISQVLGWPLAIYFIKHKPGAVPYILSSIVGIHFFLYSWLYQTPVYIGMGATICVGGFFIMVIGNRNKMFPTEKAPAIIAFFTSLVIFGGVIGLLIK